MLLFSLVAIRSESVLPAMMYLRTPMEIGTDILLILIACHKEMAEDQVS
jgi:hypothetical protein